MSASRKLKTAIVKVHESTTDGIELSLLNNVYYALDHLEEKDSAVNDLAAPALFDAMAHTVLKDHPYSQFEAITKAYNRIKAALLTALDVMPAPKRLQFALAIQHHTSSGAATALISRVSYDLDHSLTAAQSALSADELFDQLSTTYVKSFKHDEKAYLKYFEARLDIEAGIKTIAKKLENYTVADARALVARAEQEAMSQGSQAQASQSLITSNHLFGKTMVVQPQNIFKFPEQDLSTATTESNPSTSLSDSNRNPLSPSTGRR
jgi:hypothetical protein